MLQIHCKANILSCRWPLKCTDQQIKAFQAANLDAYREQMAEMETSFGALVAQLPSDTEVPGLLEDIDEKGAESGLTINSISLNIYLIN